MATIRPVLPEDLPEILDILNREILEGTAHFGTEPMTQADIEREFGQADRYPWIAAVENGQVLGFARASPWKSRGAYRRTCEIGVYVRPERHGQGIASRIYEVFIPALRVAGFKTLLGGIALPNPSSIRLHERFGFRHAGTLPSVGWKLGAWRDVGYWALVFGDGKRVSG
ncbi:MAG: GNAT family N-acetyltransferase [Fimbriimonadales bacterium]